MKFATGCLLFVGIIILITFVIMILPKGNDGRSSNPDNKTANSSSDPSQDSDKSGVDDTPNQDTKNTKLNASDIDTLNLPTECQEVESNIKLYDRDDIFVNREREMKNLSSFRYQADIILISGPPGFGKSRLAIQWGLMVVKNGTNVRYEDLRRSNVKTTLTSKHAEEKKASVMNQQGNYPLIKHTRQQSFRAFHSFSLMKELIKWSKDIICPTVLILDNVEQYIYDQNSGDANVLTDNLKAMIKHADRKLDIVVASQYRLTIVDPPIRTVHVGNLSVNSSVELIMNLTYSLINRDDAEHIAELVGGCPLALKIVAGMLSIDDDVGTFKEDLKNDLIKTLSLSDDKNERLDYIFNISFRYLDKVDLQLCKCVFSASLFPGSFSDVAGQFILPYKHISHMDGEDEFCHKILVKHSFLEKYLHGSTRRFEMHSIIREYSGKYSRKRGLHKSNQLQKTFVETFSRYFTTFLLNHTLFVKTEDRTSYVWDEHNFNYSLEHLNIEYLLQILVSKDEHNIEELQVLAFAAGSELLTHAAIEVHYHEFVNKMSEVCAVLLNSVCEDVYSMIIQHTLDNTCYSSTLADHIRSLFSPCRGVLDCNTLRQLRMYNDSTRNMWIRFKPLGHAQIYLRHLEMAYCKPIPFLNFHFPWPVLFLIASAEFAVMPTIVNNPSTLVKFIFMIASSLCVLDILCLGYDIAKSYPDLDPVIASIAEIIIYLPSFVIFLPRICMPYSRMYRESRFVSKSHISNTLIVVLIFIVLHSAYTSFPNALRYYELYY